MIDIHTHALPGVDDGAATENDALAMLRLAEADGTHTLVLTPHSGTGVGWRTSDEVAKGTAALQAAARDEGLSITLIPGAEIMVEADVVSRSDELLTLGESRYVLIELPHTTYPEVTENVIYGLQLSGLSPVLAHPERNVVLQREPVRLFQLVQRGCLAQVTAQSLVGAFGPEVQKTAELFLRCGLVQIIASDTHNETDRPPGLAAAVERAACICGPDFALAMALDIPRRLLADQALTFDPPLEPRPSRRWLSWFDLAAGMVRRGFSRP